MKASFPLTLHFAVGWAGALATLAMVGFYVPPADKVIGESYLIFFYHFPSAVNCLNLFVIGGIVSLVHLIKRTPGSDLWAAAAVEVGLLACTITMVTGSLWAKPAWGVWWNVSDPRLMTVTIMWLTYAAYLALRASIDEPVKRGRFCAVFGTIATVNVFLVYYAIQWFGKVNHPPQIDFSERSMRITQITGVLSFLVLYTAFWRLRRRFLGFRYEAARMEDALARAGA
jgi:heme exporter protein C